MTQEEIHRRVVEDVTTLGMVSRSRPRNLVDLDKQEVMPPHPVGVVRGNRDVASFRREQGGNGSKSPSILDEKSGGPGDGHGG